MCVELILGNIYEVRVYDTLWARNRLTLENPREREGEWQKTTMPEIESFTGGTEEENNTRRQQPHNTLH